MSFLPQDFGRPTPPGEIALLPDGVHDGNAAGIRFHIKGSLIPALVLDLQAGQTVFFEHHILLWKSPSLEIKRRALRGVMKRLIAGQDILVTEAHGPGQIAFSREGVGQVFPIALAAGQSMQAREHQFLAASGGVDLTWERVRGVSNLLFGGTGFFIDSFVAGPSGGVVWLHGHGNVFEKALAPGEQLDVEPGGWVYKDPTVAMETVYQGLSTGLLAASSLAVQRFTGPGRLGIQSGAAAVGSASDTAATAQDAAKSGGWAIAAAVVGGLLGGKRGG